MLLCSPVPPSKRQAAGPLTENLPNVLVCGPQKLGDQLSSPVVPAKQANVLPYETPKSRLIFRVPHPRSVRMGSSVLGRGAKPAASSRWGTRGFLGAQPEMAMPLCRLSEAVVAQHCASPAVLFPKAALT
jgi:hypothetical protein